TTTSTRPSTLVGTRTHRAGTWSSARTRAVASWIASSATTEPSPMACSLTERRCAVDDLPRLTNDEDWLDLHTDDHAIIIGQLEAYRRDFLMVRFPDWAAMSISIEQEDGVTRPSVVL